MTSIYAWHVQRGESAGLLVPVFDDKGDPVDPTTWPTTAVVRSEPGGAIVHAFAGSGMTRTSSGVHLAFTAAETVAMDWRRGWFEVIVTDPNVTVEVSMIVHGPVTVTDS